MSRLDIPRPAKHRDDTVRWFGLTQSDIVHHLIFVNHSSFGATDSFYLYVLIFGASCAEYVGLV
jgi:hypothetical protein